MPLSFPKPTKTVDEDYLDFVRSLPCLVCGRKPSDPDHLIARGWREPKRNDLSAVPLCREHHAKRQSMGTAAFNERHRIDLWREAWKLVTERLL